LGSARDDVLGSFELFGKRTSLDGTRVTLALGSDSSSLSWALSAPSP